MRSGDGSVFHWDFEEPTDDHPILDPDDSLGVLASRFKWMLLV
jgi:hypothetical protein